MREIVYAILTTDGPFTAVIPASRIHGLGGLQAVPDITEGPWAGFRMLPMERGIGPDAAAGRGGAHRQNMQLWIYDLPGHFERIDQAHKAARVALLSAAPMSMRIADGTTVSLNCVEWQGENEDQFDDQWRASTRNQSFQLIGSGI
jgi:hypothetical protein